MSDIWGVLKYREPAVYPKYPEETVLSRMLLGSLSNHDDDGNIKPNKFASVSYTHLTLPTKLEV